MKPKKPEQKNRQKELFRAELSRIDPSHALVKRSMVVCSERLEEFLISNYRNRRPGSKGNKHFNSFKHVLPAAYIVSNISIILKIKTIGYKKYPIVAYFFSIFLNCFLRVLRV